MLSIFRVDLLNSPILSSSSRTFSGMTSRVECELYIHQLLSLGKLVNCAMDLFSSLLSGGIRPLYRKLIMINPEDDVV